MIECMILGALLGLLAAALCLARPRTEGDAGITAWSDDFERRRSSERRNWMPK
jgi:hypothetical protein